MEAGCYRTTGGVIEGGGVVILRPDIAHLFDLKSVYLNLNYQLTDELTGKTRD